MLVRDRLSGRLYEVPEGIASMPDPGLYALGEVHDAWGNSLGAFLLPKIIQAIRGRVRARAQQAIAPPATVSPTVCPPCPPCPPWPPFGVRTPFGPYPYGPYPPPGGPRRRRRRRRRR